MRLTNQSAATVRVPTGKQYALVFDDDLPGFGLKVSVGGSRAWVVQYRTVLGQTRRETLGKPGLLSASEARKAAADILARVRLGGDPHSERQAAKVKAAVTFVALIEPYLIAKVSELREKSFSETTRYLNVVWKPLHDMPIDSVKRVDVAHQMTLIGKKNGPYAANRARAALSGFFSWLVGQGLAETNPTIGTATISVEGRRKRVLNERELAALWAVTASDTFDFNTIVRLLILTGQRRSEVAHLAWPELEIGISNPTPIWHLPSERTKNGLPHDVPLSQPALDLLRNRHRIEGRDLVFGRGEAGFSGFSKAKAQLDEKLNFTKPWCLHDLRRTFSTSLNNLGVLPHVVEACINHISGPSKAGVAGVYNYAAYNAEKRMALDLWGGYLTALSTKGF